jgi:hypothetical protein
MSSFEKLKSYVGATTAAKNDEFFNIKGGGSKGVKKIQTERSRVLRPIAASSMLISKGSVERGLKEMA